MTLTICGIIRICTLSSERYGLGFMLKTEDLLQLGTRLHRSRTPLETFNEAVHEVHSSDLIQKRNDRPGSDAFAAIPCGRTTLIVRQSSEMLSRVYPV